jgi:hypothetical protein
MSSMPPSFPSFDVAYSERQNRTFNRRYDQLTQRTIAKLLTPRMFAGLRLHCIPISVAEISHFFATYNTDEILVLHLLDRNVVDKAGYDCSWARLFAEVDLLPNSQLRRDYIRARSIYLDVKTVRIRMLHDCSAESSARPK